jgi:1-acyl-sn-glycerol-3-phosphate acyltransferase
VKTAVRRAAYVAGFVVGGAWFLFCSAVGLVVLLVTGGHPYATHYFASIACGGIVRMMGWKISIEPPGAFGAVRPCVFVGNHQSIMDVLVLGSVVPRGVVAVAKKEIAAIPLFGWYYRKAGNLVIERGSSEDARRLLAEAVRRIREERLSVWFMPEGHRNASPELLPFKTGAFRLAGDAQVPVVPVLVEPLTVIVDTERLLARRGTLRIRFLPALPPPTDAGDETQIVAYAARVRDVMQRELDDLSGRSTRPGMS